MEVVALMIFTTTTVTLQIQRVKTGRVLQCHQTPFQRSERVKGLASETTLREGKKPTQEQRAIDSFGKGFHMLKDHMLKDHVQTV